MRREFYERVSILFSLMKASLALVPTLMIAP
jgi:hypothetical protein